MPRTSSVTQFDRDRKYTEIAQDMVAKATGTLLQEALESAEDNMLNPYHELVDLMHQGGDTSACLKRIIINYCHDSIEEKVQDWVDYMDDCADEKSARG